MNSQKRRLKTIELTLTPYQTALLWMKNTLKGYQDVGASLSDVIRGAV